MTRRKKTHRTYRDKASIIRMTPGRRLALLRKRAKEAGGIPAEATLRSTRGSTGFAIFCVKRILESGNLITKEGSRWRLKESIAGVEAGEAFTSLDACAMAMASSLDIQYRQKAKAAA